MKWSFFLLVSELLVSLFVEAKLDTFSGEERDDGLLAFSDNEDVVDSGGEGVTCGVLHVGDVEGAGVLLNVLEDTDSADVVTTDDQNLGAVFVLNEGLSFSALEIHLQFRVIKYKYFQKRKERKSVIYLDSVVLLDIGVRISECSAVVGDDIGHLVGSHGLSFDTAELELGFLGVNLVCLKSALHVVKDSEELASFLDGDHVHDAEGVSGLSSDLAVNLNQAFLVFNNFHSLLTGESVSQSVFEKNVQRNAFSSSVGSSGGSGCVDTAELVQHPVRGSGHSLLMLLGSSCL